MPLLPGLDLARVLKMELALELQLLLLLLSPCQQPDLLRGPKPPFLLGQLAAFDLPLRQYFPLWGTNLIRLKIYLLVVTGDEPGTKSNPSSEPTS